MYKQTIWITGAEGGIGSALLHQLSVKDYYKIIATDKDVDITDIDAVKQAVDIYKPTVIINCAAISNKEKCEEDMLTAYKINALGARNLASESRRAGAKIIQISSDDVFDANSSGSMTEFDTPAAKSVYGKSKIAAENYVRELNPKHIIVRSSWVYGMSDHDFFNEIITAGKNGQTVKVPMDVISTPTSVTELAKLIELLINSNEYGTYHSSCEGMCSRSEFAKMILRLAGYDTNIIQSTFSDSHSGQTSTLLENLMLKMTDLYVMPNWVDALKEYVNTWNRK